MPYLLLCIGCIFLGLSLFGLLNSNVSVLEIYSVQSLSEQRIWGLDQIAIGLSRIGGMPFLLFLTLILCCYQSWIKNYKAVCFIGLSVVGSIGIGWLMKWIVGRPRPAEIFHLVQSYGDSFPSAHSLYAATLASLAILLFQQHRYRIPVTIFSMMWLIMMGISRVYAGVHYPTDILAGWGIGLIWTSLLWFWLYQSNVSNNLFSDKKS
ncbi:MAG: phosphatase PAP2 family protein [Acinetobacter sp.]